ncbi:MAG: tRNA (adenosine(37)-N6)-threonylcarbamoyltransferase complex dimerization subunit type 1 TsaB [Betaproteobacteria bacterium]
MNLLALDTSTEYCSVALLLDGTLSYREVHAIQRHSELVLPMIGELLSAAGLRPRQLDGVAFGAGPGSFTGLRIACGVAQGLAFGADIPVVPVGTLAALAEESGASRVIACIDARMGEIYHGIYRRDGERWMEVSAPVVCKAVDAPAVSGEGWVGAGSGFIAHSEALRQHYAKNLERVDATLHPHARAIARLARPVLLAGGGLPAEQATPLYVRDKVALKMHEQR